MLGQIGVDSLVLYDGLASLPRRDSCRRTQAESWRTKLRQFANKILTALAYRKFIYVLKAFDIVVIVNHVPSAYFEAFFDDNRLIGDLPNVPLILYDLVYLPTRGYWPKYIYEGQVSMVIPAGQHKGLDRYDYHLCVTEVSEYPVPCGAEWYSPIGVNLDDPGLRVNPEKPLTALIDFERPEYLFERAIQVQACIDAGIPYKVLHGHYSIEDIRKIYRECSIYFFAHRESFGLPICEVQACGGLIFTPYAHRCPSHYIERPRSGIPGQLPRNFVVCDNDKVKLKNELARLSQDFDADHNYINFKCEQGYFLNGNTNELQRFIKLVKDGSINPGSHKRYPSLESLVQAIGQIA